METINKNLMLRNHTAKKRTASDISFIVVHYVGALGDAYANTQYYKTTDVNASADFWVGHGGDIWQGNDYYNYYSWHCGGGLQGSGGHSFYQKCTNANSVGIEMCVKKKSTATMDATDKDWYFTDATVKSAAELVAHLMTELQVDISHVIRHYDVTGKICPNPFVYDTGAVTWEGFKQMVSDIYNGGTGQITEPKYYRVRTSWDNTDSQIGAYLDLDNAKAACLPGYTVYDWEGNAVYTNTSSGTQASAFSGLTETQAAAKLLELAKADSKTSGILPSVTAAQAVLESGYVTTDLAVNANNIFGMKCTLSGNSWGGSTWDGSSKYTKKTAEQDANGNIYYVTADFRKYSCLEDSVADHSAYLLGAMNGSALRYAGLTKAANYKDAIAIIKNGGYATDTQYISKICNIIERYALDKYDADVSNAGGSTDTAEWYRVRKTWEDAASQLGAFHDLDKAKACADKNPGYSVFDGSGKAVYTTAAQYTVQAGSFAKKANAKALATKLKAAGFDALVKKEGSQYKVQCGAFSSKANAEALVEKLKSAGFQSIIK